MDDQPLNQRLREIREALDSPAAEPEAEPTPEPRRRAPLGRLLVTKGLVSEALIERALDQQGKDGRPLGQILIEMGAVSPQNLARALTEQHGVDFSGSLRDRLGGDESDEPGGERTGAESFIVRETSDGEPLHTAPTFLDAADAAFELIEDRDPERLEIVRAQGGELEHVWSYRRAEDPAPAPS
jgi:hypothetical protein